MLDKGIIERIVLDYKDILKQATEDNMRYASELPYFEGLFELIVIQIIYNEFFRRLLAQRFGRFNKRDRNGAAKTTATTIGLFQKY